MHIELPTERILALVKLTTSIAKEADARPIYRNILLEVTETQLEISASNMEVNLWLNVKAADDVVITQEGKALVSAQNLRNVLTSMTAKKVKLFTKENMFYVVGGRSRFKMVLEPEKDFPKLLRFSDLRPFVTMPANAVAGLIKRVAFCAHNERSHYNMHGVLIRVREKNVCMAATNGQRLGVATVPYTTLSEDEDKFEEELIIPAEHIANIRKLIPKDAKEETLDLQWMKRNLNVRGALGEVTLVAVRGKFPPYEMGVPANTKIVPLNRKRLIEVLKQSTAFKASGTTFMNLEIEDGKMSLRSRVRDTGSTLIEQVISWKHEPINVILNPSFLLESASAMVGDNVCLEVEKVTNPTLLREECNDGLESFCVYSVVLQ